MGLPGYGVQPARGGLKPYRAGSYRQSRRPVAAGQALDAAEALRGVRGLLALNARMAWGAWRG